MRRLLAGIDVGGTGRVTTGRSGLSGPRTGNPMHSDDALENESSQGVEGLSDLGDF